MCLCWSSMRWFLLYELFVVAIWGKTIGKQWCRIKVVRYDTL